MLTTTLRLAKARTREDLRFAKQRTLRELKQLMNPIGADKLRRALDQLTKGANGSPILLVHSALSDCGRFTAGPIDVEYPVPASLDVAALAITVLGCALVFWRGWSVLRTLGACALAGVVLGLATSL